jgi:hypothetical protein
MDCQRVSAFFLFLCTTPALALPVCEGADRAARRLTCIVDGDTGWESGVKAAGETAATANWCGSRSAGGMSARC